MSLLVNLLSGVSAAIGASAAYAFWRPKPKPFHKDNVPPVEMKAMGLNIFPSLQFVMRNLSDSKRQKIATKTGAPRPNELRDRFVRGG